MDKEAKMLKMFNILHTDVSGSCKAVITYDEYTDPSGIMVRKDGYDCWGYTLAELTFEYITRDFED